jgi:glutamyl-tRNA reductase
MDTKRGVDKPSCLQLIMVGVNYSTTPLAVREKVSIPRDRASQALDSLGGHIGKGVILATCNRTEVYAVDSDGGNSEQAITRFLEQWSGLPAAQLMPCLHRCRNHEAVRHLVETASGLRSMIVGEHEILGQVRQALEDAEQAGMVDTPLRGLFQHAIRVGRKVRDETDISKNALSVSSVAVRLVASVAGDIKDLRVLLIGAGEAGKLVAKAFFKAGACRLTVTSRSLSSARELASYLGGTAVDIVQMEGEMAAADVVVSCTGAPHYVVRRELAERVMQSRQGRPLIFVDISVPRDVEHEVSHIDGVSVYDIDDFMQLSLVNRKAREREIARASRIIDGEVERFVKWWDSLDARPAISALIQMAEDIRRHQLNLTLKKLPPLSPEERDSLEAMTRAIVNKILHNPIQCLKNGGSRDEALMQTVEELFGLDSGTSK